MALRRSLSRPLLSGARSALRSSTPATRAARASPLSAPGCLLRQSPRLAPFRSIRELGGVMSLLPLHSVVAAARLRSHLSADARACCELSQGS